MADRNVFLGHKLTIRPLYSSDASYTLLSHTSLLFGAATLLTSSCQYLNRWNFINNDSQITNELYKTCHIKVKVKVKTSIYIARFMQQAPLTRTSLKLGRQTAILGHRQACKHIYTKIYLTLVRKQLADS